MAKKIAWRHRVFLGLIQQSALVSEANLWRYIEAGRYALHGVI